MNTDARLDPEPYTGMDPHLRGDGQSGPVVGQDADIELRDGDTRFAFTITNKPVIRHGNKRIVPSRGFATACMQDGRWEVNFSVTIHGFQARVNSDEPTKKKVSVMYAAPFGDEHPDYAAPDWLATFIREFETRLNGKAEL